MVAHSQLRDRVRSLLPGLTDDLVRLMAGSRRGGSPR
jgi:hypothetical protein